jgi:hypothetical protein
VIPLTTLKYDARRAQKKTTLIAKIELARRRRASQELVAWESE